MKRVLEVASLQIIFLCEYCGMMSHRRSLLPALFTFRLNSERHADKARNIAKKETSRFLYKCIQRFCSPLATRYTHAQQQAMKYAIISHMKTERENCKNTEVVVVTLSLL